MNSNLNLALLLQRLKEAYGVLQEAKDKARNYKEAIDIEMYHESRVKSIITELGIYHSKPITQVKTILMDGSESIIYYYGMNSDEITLLIDLVDGPKHNIKSYVIGPDIPTRTPIKTSK